jgi:hypothetical protein
MMTVQEAIVGFSQSEKAKAGIIWISQLIELTLGLPEEEKRGAEKLIKAQLSMIAQELRLALKTSKDEAWVEAEKHVDMAFVMANSGVLHECTFHLTRALSQVTTIGQRTLGMLSDKGLFAA